MSLRWGFTEGAYLKFCHHFHKELPIIIPTNTPIATASHLRDVIKYAHDNSLKGKELFGNVKVSPQANNTVKIYSKYNTATEMVLPTHTIFDLMAMLASPEGISHGYKAHMADGIVPVQEIVSSFPGYNVTHLHSDVVEFSRKEE